MAKLCPTCRKKPPLAPYTPFCSKRCSDIDLAAWATGTYAVPVVEMDEDNAGEIPQEEE